MAGRRVSTILLASALVLAACSSDDDGGVATDTRPPATDVPATEPVASDPPASQSATAETEPPATEAVEETPSTDPPPEEVEPRPAPDELVVAIETDLDASLEGCDPLDPRQCVLPFPSDATTIVDDSTETGVRVAFPDGGLPSNANGVPIDVSAWNRLDGFTPNASIVTHLPGLDPVASDLPPWTDLESSLAADATVVLIDAESGERIPLWAEPDAKAEDPADRLLVIHPAVVLEHGRTYAVAIRGLLDTDGEPIEPSAAFRAYRDRLLTDLDPIEARRESMESTFETLADAGVERDDLQLAWTFTTASTEAITGDLTAMRDLALAQVDDAAPPFEVVSATEENENPLLGRFVQGRFTIPNLMTGDGGPGTAINRDADGLPAINSETPTVEADFACTISQATLDGTERAPIVSYGHGLLGSHLEVDAGNIVDMTTEHNAVYCATKWAGFSEDDVATAVGALEDLSGFGTFTDRMHQGVVNHIVLGRLMLADDGLVANPAFQRADGTPLIDTARLVYDGNSQGGIMGSMLTAVSPDIKRAVLGVPGINYSLLLPRSIDFDTYEAIFIPAYPDPLERSLLLSVIQMLWDRSEGGGYVRNLVDDPLKGSETTPVLLHVAQGDQQVTELSALIAARTMRIPIHRPVVAEGRSDEVEPGWGLETLEYPSDDSAIVFWDSGAAMIPFEQTPPRQGEDPHERPRADAAARVQKAAFLFDEVLVDVCDAGPCITERQVDAG